MTARERTYQPGDVIASLYEVRRVVAGGMGQVCVAFHRERKTMYAVKTIQDRLFRSREDSLGFRREAETWVRLRKHPHIVQAISLREFDGRLFLILEYVAPDDRGRNTLSQHLRDRRLGLREVVLWAAQFCDGMVHAVGRGLKCHRDIKPDNIMITREGSLKISDFGLAKTVASSSARPQDLQTSLASHSGLGEYDVTSRSAQWHGTPPYMAPEVFTDYQNANEASDIYSFGVVLFEMLSGERPFTPGVSDSSAYRYLHEHAPIPALASPLAPLVQKCLAKKAGNRYQTFVELRDALRQFSSDPLPSPPQVQLGPEDERDFALALFQMGRYEDALRQCELALSLLPGDADAWNLKGWILCALGQYSEVHPAVDRAIALDPGAYAAWNNKGMAYQKEGRTRDAVRCFQKVTSLRPRYREGWNNLGSVLQSQGEHAAAIPHYRRATTLDPRYRDAWVNMGDCYIKLRQYENARECYEKAYEIDPYDDYVRTNLQKLYSVLGRPNQALRLGQRSQKEE